MLSKLFQMLVGHLIHSVYFQRQTVSHEAVSPISTPVPLAPQPLNEGGFFVPSFTAQPVLGLNTNEPQPEMKTVSWFHMFILKFR